jgi:hypothetical protein
LTGIVLGDARRSYSDAGLAWRDLAATLAAMPWLVLGGAVYVLLYAVPSIWWRQGGEADLPLWMDMAISTLRAVIMVPVSIAIYRFLVLKETTTGYRFDIGQARVRRFVKWNVGLVLASFVPLLVAEVVASKSLTSAVSIVSFVVMFYVMVRLFVLFPAIAVDAAHADWPNAVAETDGLGWYILVTIMTIWLPIVAIGLFASLTFAMLGADSRASTYVVSTGLMVSELVATTFGARFYEAHHARVGAPTQSPT